MAIGGEVMRATFAALIVLALLAAGGAVYFANQFMSETATQAEQEARQSIVQAEVLVAAVDIPPGSGLTRESFTWQPWPQDKIKPSYASVVTGGRDADAAAAQQQKIIADFTKARSRRQISAGEAITATNTFLPGKGGTMPSMLEPGMRAVTLPVNPQSAAAGFILPGDRVDVLLNYEIGPWLPQDESIELGADVGVMRRVVDTVLENVKVIALDQQLTQAADKPGPSMVAKMITVEVTPQEAKALTMAQSIGQLSLVLRPLGDDERLMTSNRRSYIGDVAVSPGLAAITGSRPVLGIVGNGMDDGEEEAESVIVMPESSVSQSGEATGRWSVMIYRGGPKAETVTGK